MILVRKEHQNHLFTFKHPIKKNTQPLMVSEHVHLVYDFPPNQFSKNYFQSKALCDIRVGQKRFRNPKCVLCVLIEFITLLTVHICIPHDISLYYFRGFIKYMKQYERLKSDGLYAYHTVVKKMISWSISIKQLKTFQRG